MMKAVKFMENSTCIVPRVSKGLHFDHPGQCLQCYICLFSERMGLKKIKLNNIYANSIRNIA